MSKLQTCLLENSINDEFLLNNVIDFLEERCNQQTLKSCVAFWRSRGISEAPHPTTSFSTCWTDTWFYSASSSEHLDEVEMSGWMIRRVFFLSSLANFRDSSLCAPMVWQLIQDLHRIGTWQRRLTILFCPDSSSLILLCIWGLRLTSAASKRTRIQHQPSAEKTGRTRPGSRSEPIENVIPIQQMNVHLVTQPLARSLLSLAFDFVSVASIFWFIFFENHPLDTLINMTNF